MLQWCNGSHAVLDPDKGGGVQEVRTALSAPKYMCLRPFSVVDPNFLENTMGWILLFRFVFDPPLPWVALRPAVALAEATICIRVFVSLLIW